MGRAGYRLAVASHKGGEGRTTLAALTAWCWSNAGLRVRLLDAEAWPAAGVLACDDNGTCAWPNVTYRAGLGGDGGAADVTLIDCPRLSVDVAQAALVAADGVLLVTTAEPLALQTLPQAAPAIERARQANPRLELLGIAVTRYEAADAVQAAMFARLKQMHGELLLEPPLPLDSGLRDWAFYPGSAPPSGPGRDAAEALAKTLAGWLSLQPAA